MVETLVSYEPIIRLIAFAGVFALMAAWELLAARRETNSSFGFNLPWWDRLFGTYRDQPAAGTRE